jgi:hypothetical protein
MHITFFWQLVCTLGITYKYVRENMNVASKQIKKKNNNDKMWLPVYLKTEAVFAFDSPRVNVCLSVLCQWLGQHHNSQAVRILPRAHCTSLNFFCSVTTPSPFAF